ncbi:hypothetical protein HNQ59_002647 [Chitinivorax tropicus]|uniref:Amine oxidase domain-containing protein n=1 Tax=Chitinivorax tropicus TaxID=714531 RepID=A0A840MSF9_9PROT|nr:FAD-dependent oxidoreductase [Chitinivorax tropicus]MBB5019346.1 hypothetical protein [Chitinivorax tropicus]
MTVVQCDVAVIGAGMAGLTCASLLAEGGMHVEIFEKSRGTGGRMATKRSEDASFDYGAQYFTVRNPVFAKQVAQWELGGHCAAWGGNVVDLTHGRRQAASRQLRFVGQPSMNTMCRHMTEGLSVNFKARLLQLSRADERWWLTFEDHTQLMANMVILAIPAPQALNLVAKFPSVAAPISSVRMTPCWAVLLAPGKSLNLDFDGAHVHNLPLQWIGRNNSKPGRLAAETWTLHATPDWSQRHVHDSEEDIINQMVVAFEEAIGRSLPHMPGKAHYWRYAETAHPLEQDFVYDPALRLGICGDWCRGKRVEDAFLSGKALARAILER